MSSDTCCRQFMHFRTAQSCLPQNKCLRTHFFRNKGHYSLFVLFHLLYYNNTSVLSCVDSGCFMSEEETARPPLLLFSDSEGYKRMPGKIYSNFCLHNANCGLDRVAVGASVLAYQVVEELLVWLFVRQTACFCLHQNNRTAIKSFFYICVFGEWKPVKEKSEINLVVGFSECVKIVFWIQLIHWWSCEGRFYCVLVLLSHVYSHICLHIKVPNCVTYQAKQHCFPSCLYYMFFYFIRPSCFCQYLKCKNNKTCIFIHAIIICVCSFFIVHPPRTHLEYERSS